MSKLNFWINHRDQLTANGYDIVPIHPNKKRPVGENWPKLNFSKYVGEPRQGVGIRTGSVCALDIDILDEHLANQIGKLAKSVFGDTIQRVGLPPKTALFYRNTKHNSSKTWNVGNHTTAWVFPKGVKDRSKAYKIEWQAKGKQSVAFGVHPDTGKPYQWGIDSPLNVSVDELPEITPLLMMEFESLLNELLESSEFTHEMNGGNGSRHSVEDVTLENVRFPLPDITLDIAADHLTAIPTRYRDDYERMLSIGAALHHQFEGSQEGLDLFDAWASESPKYMGSEWIAAKWDSFKREQGERVVSYKTVQQIVGEVNAAERSSLVESYRADLEKAETVKEFDKAVRMIAEDTELTDSYRNTFITPVKQAAKHVGITMTPAQIRKKIAPVKRQTDGLYEWLDGVYKSINQKALVVKGLPGVWHNEAFNLIMGEYIEPVRKYLDKQVSCWQVATDLRPVPKIYDSAYVPGEEELFTREGRTYLNTYSKYEDGVKPTGHPLADLAIERFQQHLKFLAGEDAQLLQDFLAHLVQYPEVRCRWAIILQGPEGCGKSYLVNMMTAILGSANVSHTNSQLIQSGYNDWAVGGVLKVCEELLMSGKNRYQTMDALKAPITDNIISISAKHEKKKDVPNSGSWLFNTNHADAIPIEIAGQRRYTVIKIPGNILERFGGKDSPYFSVLFKDMEVCSGDIGAWLNEVEISESFDPLGRAPVTAGTIAMAEATKTEERRVIEDCLEYHDNPLVTDEWIDGTVLHRCVADELDQPMNSTAIHRATDKGLKALGYERVPKKFQIKVDGVKYKHTFWSKPGFDIEENREEIREKVVEFIHGQQI